MHSRRPTPSRSAASGVATIGFALLAACGGADQQTARPEGAAKARPAKGSRPAGPQAIAFRVPRAGGTVRAYRWDRLDSAAWTSSVAVPAVGRILGFAPGPGYLVMATPKGAILWLDVRRDELLPQGPTLDLAVPSTDGFATRGEVVGVDPGNTVVRATPAGATLRARPPAPVRALVSTPDGAVVGYGHTAAGAEVWRWAPPDTVIARREKADRNASLAPGAAGGRLWIAAPGNLRALAPAQLTEALALGDLPRGPVRDVATTPSGSTVFALYDGAAAIEVVDRYRGVRVPDWPLPGQPKALRVDAAGRTLLVRPASGESAWAVDIATATTRSTLSTSWRGDLPTVAPDGTVVTVLGPDVALLDAESLQRTRSVPNGAADWWLVAIWDGLTASGIAAAPTNWAGIDTATAAPTDSTAPPDSIVRSDSGRAAGDAAASRAAAVPADSVPPPAEASPSRQDGNTPSRWLVSFASLVSEDGATALAREIRSTGAPARVVRAAGARGEVFRVVMGPFTSRDSAVRAGRTSGRPHWIVPAR